MPRATATNRKVMNPETGKWTGKYEPIPGLVAAPATVIEPGVRVPFDHVPPAEMPPPPPAPPVVPEPDADPVEDNPIVPERGVRGAVGDAELASLLDRNAIERQPADKYEHWWHPWLKTVEIRPTHNAAIRFVNYKFTPRTQNEDAFVRLWVYKQRGKNDPERWHGDTPGLIADLECGFCQARFRNQRVYQDHLQHDHLREELADHRVR
jgi:hypothetical protein